jgi:ABC-2 type transport system ATP-binding protein
VSLEIASGEIVALLGPSGCGKSTLLGIAGGMVAPDAGRVRLRGEAPAACLNPLTYVFQDFALLPWRDVAGNVALPLEHHGLGAAERARRVDDALARIGLSDFRGAWPRQLSGGMRQRVGIAQALLNDPTLLIVDEPTVGLDPEERMRFRHLLTDLAGERLVILSTHIVSDVEASATAIAVMTAGRLRFHGTPEQLIAGAEGRVWEWMIAAEQLAEVRKRFTLCASLRRPEGIRVRVIADTCPHADAQTVAPELEDAYTWLTARYAADGDDRTADTIAGTHAALAEGR